MKSIIPFTLLLLAYKITFYLSLAATDTWFFDFDLDILLTESSDRSIW